MVSNTIKKLFVQKEAFDIGDIIEVETETELYEGELVAISVKEIIILQTDGSFTIIELAEILEITISRPYTIKLNKKYDVKEIYLEEWED